MNLIHDYTHPLRGIWLGVLFWMVCLLDAQAQQKQAALTLKVVDPWGNIVPCELQRIAPNGSPERLGDTDYDRPSITIPDGCGSGCILLFYPKAGSIYHYDSTYCPYTKETFTLNPVAGEEAKKLAKNLTTFTEDTPTASVKVSFAANELADKATSKRIKEAYESHSYVEAAKFFGASTAVTYDPEQKKIVPSTELQAKVEEFQKNNGLRQTGSLDYQTFRKASGITTNDLLGGH